MSARRVEATAPNRPLDRSTEAPPDEPAPLDDAGPVVRKARRFSRADVVTVLAYLGLAGLVMYPLWTDPTGLRLVASLEDQYFNEWNLAYAAHVLTGGANPLFTTVMNPPDG